MVSHELLEELQAIIKEDYGVNLPVDTVSEIGNSLVGFFELLTNAYYETSFKTNEE